MRETNDDAIQLICVALLNLTVAPKIVPKDLEPFHNLGIDDKLLGACSIRDQQTSMPVSETKDHRALPSHTESPHTRITNESSSCLNEHSTIDTEEVVQP